MASRSGQLGSLLGALYWRKGRRSWHLQCVTVALMPWLLVLGGVSSATPAPATAISIEFDSPPGCSSADSFYEGIRNRTSRVTRAEDGAATSVVRIRLFRAGTKIKGELRLSDQEGEKETRKVDGATCDEVVEALALTVTLALDPDAILTRIAQGDASQSRSATGPPAAAPPPLSKSPTDARATTSRWELGARWTVATVVLPGPSTGPSIRTQFLSESSWGPYSVGAFVTYLRNDWLTTPEYGQFTLASAGLELCPVRTRSNARVEVGLCALGLGGWLGSKGVALDHPESPSRSWWAVGLEALGATKVWGRFYVGANLGATAPLFRREFTVNRQPDAVARSPLIAFHGGLGFDYRF